MKNIMPKLRTCALSLAALGLSGCIMTSPKPNDPNYAPVMAPPASAATHTPGSLYASNSNVNLFSDRKAQRVGDILTILLSETTVSKKTSKVGVKKKADVGVADATLLGKPVTLDTQLSADRNFAGDANAAQSNNLEGDVTVSVVEVWPNGTLVVRGEKWITINRGDEFIRITGLVRPEDVRPDNSVLSTKVADARITYSGTGALADSQSVGWLSRFFNSVIWPF
jgi:flagellar L-ring protein FlgH